LLYHLVDPQAVVQRLAASLRSGGVLLIEDVDFFPVHAACSSGHRAFLSSLAAAVGARAGHDGFWAAQALPVLARHADLCAVELDVRTEVLRGRSEMADFWTLTAEQIADGMPESSRRALLCGAEALQDPTFRSLSSANVGVVGYRR
jgi:hypothetical protein